jgi:taurine dioxygenase
MSLQTSQLGPGYAAEVRGVDPAREIGDGTAKALRDLLDRHQLLVFRDAELDAGAQIRFIGIFCKVWDERQDKSSHSYVSNVVGNFPQGRLLFHQDYAFTAWPHRVQSLYAEELSGPIAPTLFASNVRAYEKTSAEQRATWKGLTTVHARDNKITGTSNDEFVRLRLNDRSDGEDRRRYPRAEHPVIWNHPRTGQPMLFVNEYYCSHVPQLDAAAGEAVIQAGVAISYDPAGIYTHDWRPKDLVVWDNIALQHARAAVDPASRRTLRRVIANDHVGEQDFDESRKKVFGG